MLGGMPSLGGKNRIAAVVAIATAFVACSSSTTNKVVGEENCSAGEVTTGTHTSGCPASKVCHADGKGYGPCTCTADGGTGGSDGAAGTGGTSGGGNGTGGTSGGNGTGGTSGGGNGTGGTSG